MSHSEKDDRLGSRPPPAAWGYAAGAALLWSTVATAFKLALRELAPVQVLAAASATSALALFLAVLLLGRWPVLLRQDRSGWLRSAGLGFLNPLLYYLVLFKAYSLLPAQEAQPLNNVWPVVLSLLAVPLLKQRLSLGSLGAIGVSFLGVVVVSTRGDVLAFRVSRPVGTVLALGSSVIWALFWLLNARDRRDPVVRMFCNFLFGAVYILIVYGWIPHPSRFRAATVFECVYIGLFEMGITFLLWGRAVELSRGAAAIVNLAYLSPFLSLLFIHFIAGEVIRASSVVGLALIVGGILLQAALFARGRSGAGAAECAVDG